MQQPQYYQKYYVLYVSQVPGQQFVIINNQMVPVYTVSPPLNTNPQMNPIQNVVFQPPPESDGKQPQNIVYQPIQGIPLASQPQNPLIAQVPTSGTDEYTHNVVCYVVIYLLLFSGCIGVQFGLYGSRTAAALWITSYVLLLATMVWFYIVKQRTQIWLLMVQIILLILSLIFEISAFAMAVSHPVLYDYQPDVTPSQAIYNDRRLMYGENYDNCTNYFANSSIYDYYLYYSWECNSILGFTDSSDSDMNVCRYIYTYRSTEEYQQYYQTFCDPILGFQSDFYQTGYEFCSSVYTYDYTLYLEYYEFFCDSILFYTYYDEDEYYPEDPYYGYDRCQGYYYYYSYTNDYCYPLQYGMMAYAVVNLVAYLVLFGALMKRIVAQLKLLKVNQKTGMAPQQLPQPQDCPQAF